MDRRTISTGQAAAELGIHKTTLLRWLHEGRIQAKWMTPKGQYRWDIDDLERQLDAPPQTSQADKPQPSAVVAAIITSRQGFLAVHRRDHTPPWSFPAGESEPAESPRDTVVREVKEETGLLINATDVIYERLHPRTGRHMIYVGATLARGRDQDMHVGDENELDDVRWLTLREAEALMPDMAAQVHQYLDRRLSGSARGSRRPRKPDQLPYEAAS